MGIDSSARGLLPERIAPALGESLWSRFDLNHFPPRTPFRSAANIRSVQIQGSAHASTARASPACLALVGTSAVFISLAGSVTFPPSCVPLLQARYGPSSLLRTLCLLHRRFFGLFRSLNAVLCRCRYPRFTRSDFRPFRLQTPYVPSPPLFR